MKKLFYSLLIFGFGLLSLGQLSAQTLDYKFTSTTGTFTPLTGATAVTSIQADEQLSAVIPIGFNFQLGGVVYTKLKASSNGWLQLDTTKTSSRATNDLDNVAEPIIAPLWDDLDGRATGGSSASYTLTGSSPNQVFTFEWLNWEWRWNSTSPKISFQVKLYEGSNKIEFIYRPAAASASTPSASVGFCSASTGAGTFLSLGALTANPSVSYTVETANIATMPDSGRTYSFTPSTCAMPTGLKDTLTSNTSTDIIFNTNATTGSAYLVEYGITGSSTISTASGTTAGSKNTVSISGLSASSNYTVKVRVVCSSADTSNWASYSFSTLYQTPISEDFTGFTGSNLSAVAPGWDERYGYPLPSNSGSYWTTMSTTQKTFFGKNGAKINLYTNNRREWMISPRFMVASTDSVKFWAAITNYNGTSTSGMHSDDSVKIMVSNDGGSSWSMLMNIAAANAPSNSFTKYSASLGTYTGQAINVALYASDGSTSGTPDYDFHVTDVFLGTPPNLDMKGVSARIDGCLGNNQQVFAVIQNGASSTINFATNNTTVGVKIGGKITSNLSTTLNSDTLAAGDTMHIMVGTANLSATGSYTFKTFTAVSGDGNATNDSSTTQTIVNDSTYGSPQEVNFAGFNGSNLSTVFPGWNEYYGSPVPTATGALWNQLNTAQLNHFGTTGAKLNLYTNNRREWIISPKLNAISTDTLFFKVAAVEYNDTTPTPMGSDDSVKVFISNNCGDSWTQVMVFDTMSGVTNSLTSIAIPIGAYAGDKIYVAFYGTDGTVNDAPDYDFVVTDIYIGTRPQKDFGVVQLYTPVQNQCGQDSALVEVIVKNFGIVTQTNVGVKVDITGSTTTSLTATISSLAPDAMDTILVGKFPSSAGGTFNFKSYTTLAGDQNESNDTNVRNGLTIIAIPNAPNVPSPVFVCSNSDTTLRATGGSNYRWFDESFGGVPISNYDSLELLNIQADDTFYVETYVKTTSHVGPADNTIGTGGTYTTYSDGLVFNVTKNMTLDSVSVYTGSAGNVVVRLLDNGNNVLFSTSVAVTASGLSQIPVGFTIAPGSGYKLDATGSTVSNLYRNSAGASMPYSNTDGSVTITSTINNLGGYYYFFYNWVVTTEGCASNRTEVVLNMLQSPSINIGNDTTFCSGVSYSVNFDATYSSALSYLWHDNSGSPTFTATLPGIYYCEVTDQNGCKTVDTAEVINLALPMVSFPNLNNVCANNSLINLSGGTPTGGTYSGAHVSSNVFDPGAAGFGMDTIAYTYTDSNNCTSSDTATIMVDSVTSVTSSGLSNFCLGTPADSLKFGSPVGGIYYGSNVSQGMFNPSMVGTTSVRYVYTNAQNCKDSVSEAAVVDTIPTVSHGAVSDVCENTPSMALSGGIPSTGMYSGAAVSGSLFIPSVAGAGMDTIQYNVTDGNNCTGTVDVVINVLAKPAVAISALGSLCESAAVRNLTEGSPAGGTYSGNGVSGTSFDPTATGVGSNSITYTFTDGNNCTDSASANISVEANPVFTISGNKESCGDNPISLNTTLPNLVYDWSDGTKAATFTTKNSGQVWVKVTDTNTVSNCFSYDTVTVKYDAICLGVSEALTGNSVKYFPNPNNGSFNYQLEGFGGLDVTVHVLSANGQVVYNEIWNEVSEMETGVIDLNGVETGMYFIHLTTEKGSITHRITVTK